MCAGEDGNDRSRADGRTPVEQQVAKLIAVALPMPPVTRTVLPVMSGVPAMADSVSGKGE
jgi:hypothetical protein